VPSQSPQLTYLQKVSNNDVTNTPMLTTSFCPQHKHSSAAADGTHQTTTAPPSAIWRCHVTAASASCLPTSFCDFHLFALTKKYLAGKRFATDPDVKQAVPSWPPTLDTDLCYTGTPGWHKPSNVNCDYAEGWRVPCAAYRHQRACYHAMAASKTRLRRTPSASGKQ
jgi:hypothetical protein